jgi:acetyl-CoA decarbonylase/synthase complex subunit delta
MDRIEAAALSQNDNMLQMPIITPVGSQAWGVKEALVSEDDMPAWGPQEDRGINMENCTATACLASGSNAVILRHPTSVATVAAFIDSLM